MMNILFHLYFIDVNLQKLVIYWWYIKPNLSKVKLPKQSCKASLNKRELSCSPQEDFHYSMRIFFNF